MAMETFAALDPFRAEVRLLQVAAEIEGRMLVLVIDLRNVPLGSPALAPLWCCKLVGHNLGFDVKMLMANGVEIADENLVDTILLAGTRAGRGHGDHRLPTPSRRRSRLTCQRHLRSRHGGAIGSPKSRSRTRHSTACSRSSLRLR